MATDPRIAKRLKQMQGNYKESAEKAKKGGFESTPAGKYLVKIDSVELGESQNSGKLQVTWTSVITDESDRNGKKHIWWSGLENHERAFEFLCWSIKAAGYEIPASIEGIPEWCEQISADKPTLRIQVTHSPNSEDKDNPFVNTKVMKRVNTEE